MTEDELFDEKIRMIVRDEMEAEWLEVKGYADQVREMAFGMCKAIITANCEMIIKSFADGPGAGK